MRALLISLSLVCMAPLTRAESGPFHPPSRGPVFPLRSPSRVTVAGGFFEFGAGPDLVAASQALCKRLAAADRPRGPGCDGRGFQAEGPARRVYLNSYSIDLTEVTVADYARCQGALRCPPLRRVGGDGAAGAGTDTRSAQHPVVAVTYDDAQAYCRFVGGQLPTEAQWERAARGGGTRLFPWGSAWDPERARHRAVAPVDAGEGRSAMAPGPMDATSLPRGASAHGLLHMAGNVWEMTRDAYRPGHPERGPAVDPKGPATGSGTVIRGGSFRSGPLSLRVTARDGLPDGTARDDVGFRCAYAP